MTEEARYTRQHERLQKLAAMIAEFVAEKDRQYGSSWRTRGGVGAFMIIARKWDRIEQICKSSLLPRIDGSGVSLTSYDIFQRFQGDVRDEGIKDDVVDLIGYLLVLLEHMIELEYVHTVCGRGFVPDEKPQSETPGSIRYYDKHYNKVSGMESGDLGHAKSCRTEMRNPFGYDEKEES